MILETSIAVVSVLFGGTALLFSMAGYRKARQHRGLLEFLGKQNEDLEECLTLSRQTIEKYAARMTDQSRRVAWIETRIRQPKPEDDLLADTVLSAPTKSNMTERRHRVLTLASRGQQADNIASTLGMMRGEVELIINLNRVAA